jgi:hypothetical protein
MPCAPPPPPDPHEALPLTIATDRAAAQASPRSDGGMASVSSISPRAEDPPAPCDHLHDTTSRYDHSKKLLSFLLVCPVCKTEKLIHSLHYEPRFEPNGAPEPAGATVHQFPRRESDQPDRRAA